MWSSSIFMLETSGLSIILKGDRCVHVVPGCCLSVLSGSHVVVEAPQQSGLVLCWSPPIRFCSRRFKLSLSLLQLLLFSGRAALSWGATHPFLVCSNFKSILRWTSVSVSSPEGQPRFYLSTCFSGIWWYYVTLKPIIITFLCAYIEF